MELHDRFRSITETLGDGFMLWLLWVVRERCTKSYNRTHLATFTCSPEDPGKGGAG